eukprot:PRCOL_00005935-RA
MSNVARAELAFKSGAYVVGVAALPGDTLCVEAERVSDGCRWRGDFTARYVEDLTNKTGNFKKFAVFARMLQSAVTTESDSVFVDLLTYQDLEALKRKKGAAGGGGGVAAGGGAAAKATNKRYLILTYAAEFDRVHYPLPLLEEEADVGQLRAQVKLLRGRLREAEEGGAGAGTANGLAAGTAKGAGSLDPGLRALLKERDALAAKLDARTRECKELRAEARAAADFEHQAASLRKRVQRFEDEAASERAASKRSANRVRRELADAQDDLRKSRESERRLRAKVRELTAELETARRQARRTAGARGGGSGAPRSRSSVPSSAYSAYGARASSRGASASRERTPAGSRAGSRSGSRASSRGPSADQRYSRSPASASSVGKRFDPTAYIAERNARIAASRQRSRSPSVDGGVGARRGASASPAQYHSTRGVRPASATARAGGAAAPGLATETGAAARGGIGIPSRESPGRALRAARERLESEYGPGAAAVGEGEDGPQARKPAAARALDVDAGAAGPPGGVPAYDEAAQEIADIDSRLHALQAFLKSAKDH